MSSLLFDDEKSFADVVTGSVTGLEVDILHRLGIPELQAQD